MILQRTEPPEVRPGAASRHDSVLRLQLLESWIKFRTSGFRIESYDSLWGNPVLGSVFRTWFSGSMLQMWLKKIKYPQGISIWIKSWVNSKIYISLKIYCLCPKNSNCISIYLSLQLLTVLLITVEMTTIWLQFDYNDSWAWGIGFWEWAATILYPSSKHTALVKNSHQYALQQKVTLRLPLVSREV